MKKKNKKSKFIVMWIDTDDSICVGISSDLEKAKEIVSKDMKDNDTKEDADSYKIFEVSAEHEVIVPPDTIILKLKK